MQFINRLDAAVQLARHLDNYKDQEGIILAVPRGGVPIGFYLARELNFALDLLMTKKMGHPQNKEYAIGAVGLEDSIIEETSDYIPQGYIEDETERIRRQLTEQYKKFTGDRRPLSLEGKIVIVVDDGIATGRTILASLSVLRKKNPKKITVAVPVSSRPGARRIQKEVDDLVCLYAPSSFHGVGDYYTDFSPVKDEEVIALVALGQGPLF